MVLNIIRKSGNGTCFACKPCVLVDVQKLWKMSKYKVGDVAALFSKPKEPTTESGKKLQALFKQFQSKNKDSSEITEKAGNNLNEGKGKVQNQRVSKKEKKRKFSAFTSEETDEVNNNTKKFKKVKNEATNSTELQRKHFSAEINNSTKKFKKGKKEATNSTELKEKHFPAEVNNNTKKFKKVENEATNSTELKGKHFSAELDFPRKKKSSKANKNNLKDSTFNSFREGGDTLSDNIKQTQDGDFKSKMKSNDKKQISNFIRKSKQRKQAAINGAIKSKDSENMSDKDTYANGTLFKEDNEEFVEQSVKKQKKKKHSNGSFVQNKKSSDIGENKILFKKSYGNNKQNSQPIISGEGEPDFIKLPYLKSEDAKEKLSRTLFVANLPVTIKRKALETLFSPFGEIEWIRFRGLETDKAKIFNKKGPQALNPKNYAADSIPAFITFYDRESAVKALSLSGSFFQGRHITVDFALPAGAKKMYDDKRSIFIGNLPFDCQDESIWEAFSECGRIENVRIVRDKQTGIGKGFGYVQFSTVQSKENALGLEDLEIQGRTIRIKAVSSNPSKQKKGNNPGPAKIDTFKSQAIKIKKKNKDSTSRKSVKKIMKKQKNLHKKKKNCQYVTKVNEIIVAFVFLYHTCYPN